MCGLLQHKFSVTIFKIFFFSIQFIFLVNGSNASQLSIPYYSHVKWRRQFLSLGSSIKST